MNTFISGWYVVYTRPRHEKKVAVELTNNSINYYLPVKKEVRRWRDRNKILDVPLFQSYVFVQLTSLKDYYEGLKINGVIQYVRVGKQIARVQEKVIKDIQLIVDHGEDLEVSCDHFRPGQMLMIREGALTGITCEVIQLSNKQRILVRLQLLQRSLLMTLPAEQLMTVAS